MTWVLAVGEYRVYKRSNMYTVQVPNPDTFTPEICEPLEQAGGSMLEIQYQGALFRGLQEITAGGQKN